MGVCPLLLGDRFANLVALLRRGLWLLLGGIGVVLAPACVFRPSPVPPLSSPTPPPLVRLLRPPDLALYDLRAYACAQQAGLALLVETLPWSRLASDARPRGDILLLWGPETPGQNSYALDMLGAQPVTQARYAQPLTLATLRTLYRSTGLLEAPDSRPWRALLPPPGHPVYTGLRALVDPYPWSPDVLWTSSPEHTLAALAEDVPTLGWLPDGWPLPAGVQILAFRHSSVTGPWPVVAVLHTPYAATWVACMQAKR